MLSTKPSHFFIRITSHIFIIYILDIDIDIDIVCVCVPGLPLACGASAEADAPRETGIEVQSDVYVYRALVRGLHV